MIINYEEYLESIGFIKYGFLDLVDFNDLYGHRGKDRYDAIFIHKSSSNNIEEIVIATRVTNKGRCFTIFMDYGSSNEPHTETVNSFNELKIALSSFIPSTTITNKTHAKTKTQSIDTVPLPIIMGAIVMVGAIVCGKIHDNNYDKAENIRHRDNINQTTPILFNASDYEIKINNTVTNLNDYNKLTESQQAIVNNKIREIEITDKE